MKIPLYFCENVIYEPFVSEVCASALAAAAMTSLSFSRDFSFQLCTNKIQSLLSRPPPSSLSLSILSYLLGGDRDDDGDVKGYGARIRTLMQTSRRTSRGGMRTSIGDGGGGYVAPTRESRSALALLRAPRRTGG